MPWARLVVGLLFAAGCGGDAAGSLDAPADARLADAAPDASSCLGDARLGTACASGVGACQRSGTWVCTADMTDVTCDAVPGAAGPETCLDPGVDNDCDGTADDVDGAGVDCPTALPGVCAAGRTACVDDNLACLPLRAPGDETCSNQGIDDDCDGVDTDLEVDEAAHLLLSEIMTRPTEGEAVEIYNPTLTPVPLGAYALADFTSYFAAPIGPYPTRAAGSDFIVSFPAATLGPCERRVVSVGPADVFMTARGSLPDFEILNAAEIGTVADNAAVPNLEADLAAAVPVTRGLTDDAEMVVLFRLDAGGVTDVDYVAWGAAEEVRVDKTGVPGFVPDTAAAAQDIPAAPADGESLHRCTPGETGERAQDGNGVAAHDETSERLASSWTVTAGATPGAPDPTCVAVGCAGLLDIGMTCASGFGVCQASGVYECGPSHANLICNGVPTAPGPETCADLGSDDDCDSDTSDVDGLGAACGAGCAENVCVGPILECRYPRDHLLLTEVIVTPDAGEAVEILNPTVAAIDLTGVAVADYNAYHTLGGAIASDFAARFPDGATLPACGRIVVALRGDGFATTFGVAADYEVVDTPAAVPLMVAVDVGGNPSLTNGAEVIVLFRIDAGGAHKDLDYVAWGADPTVRVDKTGVTGFLPDTPAASQSTLGAAHASGGSFHRCLDAEGAEIASGGNGATGHDETSERWDATWHTALAVSLRADDPTCP